MSFDDTIKILLGRGNARSVGLDGTSHPSGHEPLGPIEWKRVKARVAWVSETVAAWGEAQRQMHERCCALVNRVSEEEFDRICDEEQAKVDAIRAQLEAVIRGDRWPPELHWTL